MAQVIRLTCGDLTVAFLFIQHRFRTLPAPPMPGKRGRFLLQSAKFIKHAAMSRSGQKSSPVMLSVNFDQRFADRFQHGDGNRLIVDKTPATPFCGLHPAQDHLVLARIKAVFLQHLPDRMGRARLENHRHHALFGALTHSAALRPAAHRKPQRIQQDRLAGPGFAGQRSQARPQRQARLVDQNEILNMQRDQHRPNRHLQTRHPFAKGRRRNVHSPAGPSSDV